MIRTAVTAIAISLALSACGGGGSSPMTMQQPPALEPMPEQPGEMQQPPAPEPMPEQPGEMQQPPAPEPMPEQPGEMQQPPALEPMPEQPGEMQQPPAPEPMPEQPGEMQQPPVPAPAPEPMPEPPVTEPVRNGEVGQIEPTGRYTAPPAGTINPTYHFLSWGYWIRDDFGETVVKATLSGRTGTTVQARIDGEPSGSAPLQLSGSATWTGHARGVIHEAPPGFDLEPMPIEGRATVTLRFGVATTAQVQLAFPSAGNLDALTSWGNIPVDAAGSFSFGGPVPHLISSLPDIRTGLTAKFYGPAHEAVAGNFWVGYMDDPYVGGVFVARD